MTTPLEATRPTAHPWLWALLTSGALGLLAVVIVLSAGPNAPTAQAIPADEPKPKAPDVKPDEDQPAP